MKRRILLISCVVLAAIAIFLWWNSPDQKTRRLLDELCNRPVGKFSFSFSRSTDAIDEDFRRLGPKAVPALIDALHNSNSTARYLAAGKLGQLKDRRAVDPLIAALEDDDFVVRKWAAGALGDIGDRKAVEPLLARLEDKDAGFRFMAADALGKIGDPRAIEPLIALLHDPALYPRAYAATALGSFADHRAIDALIRSCRDDTDSWVHRQAEQSLRQLGVAPP